MTSERHYAVERDRHGTPVRMVWLGDENPSGRAAEITVQELEALLKDKDAEIERLRDGGNQAAKFLIDEIEELHGKVRDLRDENERQQEAISRQNTTPIGFEIDKNPPSELSAKLIEQRVENDRLKEENDGLAAKVMEYAIYDRDLRARLRGEES